MIALVCAFMFADAHCPRARMCRLKVSISCLPHHFPHHFLRPGLSLNLKISSLDRLTNQNASHLGSTCLCTPSSEVTEAWHYTQRFKHGFQRSKLRSLSLYKRHSSHWALSQLNETLKYLISYKFLSLRSSRGAMEAKWWPRLDQTHLYLGNALFGLRNLCCLLAIQMLP